MITFDWEDLASPAILERFRSLAGPDSVLDGSVMRSLLAKVFRAVGGLPVFAGEER